MTPSLPLAWVRMAGSAITTVARVLRPVTPLFALVSLIGVVLQIQTTTRLIYSTMYGSWLAGQAQGIGAPVVEVWMTKADRLANVYTVGTVTVFVVGLIAGWLLPRPQRQGPQVKTPSARRWPAARTRV